MLNESENYPHDMLIYANKWLRSRGFSWIPQQEFSTDQRFEWEIDVLGRNIDVMYSKSDCEWTAYVYSDGDLGALKICTFFEPLMGWIEGFIIRDQFNIETLEAR